MRKKVFVTIVAAVAALGNVTAAGTVMQIRFDQRTNLQKSGAVIDVQEDKQPAVMFGKTQKPQSMMFFWLKKDQYEGKTLKFTVEAKGKDLSNSFVFGLQGRRDGKMAWPAGAGARGTFDWKKISFTADFAKLHMESVAVRIGLQNTSGKLWVKELLVEDLSEGKGASNKPMGSYSGQYGSVDFSPNKFHVPDYNASRNLIQNPSFEAGTDFWTPAVWGALDHLPEDGEPLLSLDRTTAVDGKVSMCQRVIEGGKGGWPPATFAIPLEQGQDYTLSFYAKTDKPAAAVFEVTGITDRWDAFLPKKRYKLGAQWKRYTYQFKSPRKMVQLHLGAPRKANPCKIWIDAVQLEKGRALTDFTRVPVAVTLVTDSPDNLSQPGEKANARISVATSMPTTGTVSYVVKDFFCNVADKGTLPFTTVESQVPVELPLTACDKLDSGAYTIEAKVTLANGVSHTTWHRLVRMYYVTEPFKHRRMFCIPEVRGNGNWEAAIEQAKKIGFGSFEFSHYPPAQYKELLDKHGFVWSADVFRHEGWPPKVEGKYRMASANFGLKEAIKDGDIAEIADEIAKHSVETVKAYPKSVAFETVNEPFCQTEEDIANTVKILRRVREEAKKVNPEVRFMTPDCANIDHTMKYLETFFEKGGADVCDIVALHTYRGHPDALDGDLAKVIGLTDKYKPGADIWSTEGGYYNTYIIPDIGFPRVTHGGDHYRTGNMSYDLGLGEKIALAYQTRFRVQALKYADRLKRDVDWNDVTDWRTGFGIKMIPTAGVFATNTPARLLGNADFVADLKLPQTMRGYLFKDDLERPVAVIWYTNDAETLYKDANPAQMEPGAKVEAFNVVGGTINYDKEIALTGYPVFLRGKTGQVDEYRKTIETAKYTLPEVGEQLGHTFEFKEDGSFTAKFSNRFNKILKGELVCKVSGKEVLKEKLNLKPYGTSERTISFPASKHSLTSVNYSYRFHSDGGQDYAKDLEIKYFTAPQVSADTFNMDGDWKKWDSISKISTDNTTPPKAKDRFAADTRWAWNKDYLYCLVDVTDGKFEPSNTIQFPTRGDCVEFFFDAYADSVKNEHHKSEGYAEDDQYYTMWFNKNGKADAYRSQEAHWQLSFNKPGRAYRINSNYALTSKGYRMQTAFPMREIKPVELIKGGCFGMNILARDKGVGKTIFGNGEMPLSWRSPRNYVFVFLGE